MGIDTNVPTSGDTDLGQRAAHAILASEPFIESTQGIMNPYVNGVFTMSAQAERVRREVLKGGVVRSGGQLELEFLSGATFIFGPAPAYESWTAFRSDGYGVVCMPGGGLAIFIPAEPE